LATTGFDNRKEEAGRRAPRPVRVKAIRPGTVTKGLFIFILFWPLVAWIGAVVLITEAPLEHADVIVVLGGSANYRERAREAAQLQLQGRSDRVVLTNDNLRGSWSSAQQRNPFFYERSRDEINDAGVPLDRIDVLMTPVANTHDEAMLVRQYAEERRLRSVLVVTSAYHSRRALWVFTRVFRNSGIQIGLVSVRHGAESPTPLTWWLTSRGWRSVPTEYIKMIYYVFKYR
jgi:uncharacterized SAM-binding protein YcdF (DUF218 family)